jgi:hypothetical protein
MVSDPAQGAIKAVMVVLGTTSHEFACRSGALPDETRGWSHQVRP